TTYARASYAQELQGATAVATHTMQMAAESAGNADDLAWATSQLGDLAFNRGDLTSAARSYRRAMQVAPDFIAAHAGMANVDAARGHLPAAVAGYEWVVARYPLPQYVIALGDLYSRTGNDSLADHEYRLLG